MLQRQLVLPPAPPYECGHFIIVHFRIVPSCFHFASESIIFGYSITSGTMCGSSVFCALATRTSQTRSLRSGRFPHFRKFPSFHHFLIFHHFRNHVRNFPSSMFPHFQKFPSFIFHHYFIIRYIQMSRHVYSMTHTHIYIYKYRNQRHTRLFIYMYTYKNYVFYVCMSRKRMLYPKEKAWAGLPIVGGPCQSLGISAATEDCLRTASKHCDAHKKPTFPTSNS